MRAPGWLALAAVTAAAAHDVPPEPLPAGPVQLGRVALDTAMVGAEDCPAHPEGVPACVHALSVVDGVTRCQVLVGQAYFELDDACRDAIDGHMYVDCIQTGHTPELVERIGEACR